MDNVFLTLVPAAIGIAVSPAPIIELILVLFSKRRVANSIAFIVTLLAMTVIVLIIGALGGRAAESGSSDPSTVFGWVLTILGVLLLLIGVRNWLNRKDTSEPAVFQTITGLGPAAVAFLAFGAVAVNPKNTVLLLAAGQTIGDSTAPWLLGAGFVVLATLPYTVSVGYSMFGGQRAADRLDRMRAWLVARNRLIMGIICVVLGAVLIARGVSALL